MEKPSLSWGAETSTEAEVQWKKALGKGSKARATLPTPSLKLIVSSNQFKCLPIDKISAVKEVEGQLTAAKLKLFHAQMKAHKASMEEIPPFAELQ
jgi:hypothetical protein